MSRQTLLNSNGFRMIFNQSPIPQMIYHPDGTIILANPALTNLLNYSHDELGAMTLQDVIVPQAHESESAVYLGKLDTTIKIERVCNRKDHPPIHTAITVHGLSNSNGNYVANIGLFEDITALHELRYGFQLFTHDISLPLSVIHSISSMLAKEDPPLPPETVEEFIATLYSQSQYARELLLSVNQQSALSNGQKQNQETVQVNHFLRQIWDDHRTLAKGKAVNLSYQPLASDLSYRLNPILMRQALSNLIDNAIKYTPPNGDIQLSANLNEDELVICVCDTGLGIPEDDLSKVFDRYFRVGTTEHQAIAGTGLGLSIIKAIASQHDGRVWVESELGKGSTFFIALPLSNED